MASRPTRRFQSRLGRRVVRRLGWLFGAPLAFFRFMRRQIPVEAVDPAGALPPSLPEDPDLADREGERAVGPVVHRLYGATIHAPKLTPERLLAIIAADPNVIAPVEVLRFEKAEKANGGSGGLQEGDELLIQMAGPWSGPVRVSRRWDTGFRLVAQRGHPQLGQVEIRARDNGGDIEMEIQTRERAAGLSFHVLQRIGLIQRMQSYTWAEMLENAAQLAGGRRPERVTVQSWRASSSASGSRGTGRFARRRRPLSPRGFRDAFRPVTEIGEERSVGRTKAQ
jgi:hypothetical protein